MASRVTRNSNNKGEPIKSVFFEQQYGRLCGEHCLNNALQEKSFDPVSLSAIGQVVDSIERGLAYQDNKNDETSSNYDDTGYFSVNVLEAALAEHHLSLVPLKSTNEPKAAKARSKPVEEKLFIFHENDHWYCARRFAEKQWIMLDSLKPAPTELKDSELNSLVLSSEKNRQVYFVIGDLIQTEADEVYSRVLQDESGATRVFHDKGQALGSESSDMELERAVSLSLGKTEAEIIRERREKFLQRFAKPKEEGNDSTNTTTNTTPAAK